MQENEYTCIHCAFCQPSDSHDKRMMRCACWNAKTKDGGYRRVSHDHPICPHFIPAGVAAVSTTIHNICL